MMTKRLVASRSESRTIFPLPFLLNFFTVSGLNAFLRSLVNKRPNSTIGKAVGLVFFILVSFQLLSQSSSQDGTTNKAYAIPTNSNLEISGDITLEAWLRPNAPQTNIGNVLMKGSYGYAFGIMNDGTIAFWQSGSQNSGPESTASIVQDGVTWTHVAIVNQGGVGTTFYINGVAVGSNATGGSFQTQAGDLYIGRQGAGCNCNFFNGLIDELRVWNDVRTAGEISANYDQVVSETEQGLAAYYRFNEGSGTTIYDEVTETAYTPSVNAISWNAENALSGASYFVDETASGSDDGTSWVDAFPYLQSALDIAISGDKIFVADGDYKPSTQVALNGTGNEQTFLIPSGVQLYGGFAGGEDITLQSSFDNRDFLVNETILNGDINGDDTAPVVNTSVQPLTLDYGTNRSDNALHVVAVQDATTQVIIDGFTIQNGHNDGTPTQYGGGLYVDASAGVSSEVRVENCVFRWNRADRGAAIGAYEPDAGAIINLTVLNSEVYQNSGYNYGAVHFQTSGTAVSNNYFVNTIFRENRTDYDGAAIMMITPGGDLDIINSLFYENDANRFYGGISAANVKDLRVINSTFANNYSHTNTSGGLHLGTHTSNLVRNSIFWGNTINIATDYQITVSSGSLNIGYSLVEGGATNINGTNTFNSGSNLTSDPLFADAANGDFTLQVSSPASEMGDAASLPTDIYDLDGDADTGEVLSLDLAGGVRVQGTVDMGAFETLGTTPNYALDFDGVNDYVNTDLAFSGQVFTAEFWVNPGSTQVNYASILDNNHNGSQGWTFIQNNSNLNEYWFFTPSSVNAYVTLPADTWSHVALVHNNVSLEKKIYLNGVLVANVAVTGDINYVTPDLYIGDWVSNTGTRPFNGQIDEVRIWNTARSTSEIVEYKDVKLSGTEPNLVAYYDFSDGPSSSTLTDQSLNSNNGTLNNMDPANDWIDAGFSLGDPYPFTIYNLVVTPDNNDALVDITTSTNVDLYYVITTTNDVPSPAQIQAGLNQAGAQAFNYSNYGGVTGAANFGVGDTNHTSGNDLISGNTYFIHWVGENAGQYSNILSAEFTTTTPPPPSDITITTISVSGGNLPQGSTDNLVYSFQMDVATSNAAAQGFQFNLAGTSVDADFEVNGVTLEVSTVSDFSSGVTSLPGTYDPTTNFGGADIQALDATEYVAGTTYYFRLSLDIAPGATAGNTFNVIAPVEGNFFFSNGIGTFNDGAITAGNTFTIGTPNYTLNFDGVSHAVTTIGNAPISGASPRTLEFLYKPLSNSGLQFPISYGTKAGGTYFGVQNNSGQLVFNGYAADLATGFTFTTGTWYHIAITFDGTTVKTFVDGNPTPTPSANLTLNTTATAIVFGGTTDGERITGQLDEVRLWDYAKSQAQVAAFMAQELDTASPPPGLLSYYDFSDGPNSSILTDQVSGNNANLNGMDAANDWVIADHGISGSGTTDSTNPSVLITSSESGTTTLATIPITITFSEKVVNFDLADITVGNGLASNFATSDTIVFTVDVAPSVGGIVTVDILSSVTTDLTGNGNDASAQFSIDYIAPENALDFDGVDDNILGSGINLANSDFTIEVWFNTSSPTSSQTIISVGDSETANETLHIRLENSDVRIGLAFDDVVVPWTVTTGWHHLAVIHNTSTLFSELYIDGVSIGSGTHSNPFIGNTNFKMGSNGWSVSALFEGEMDDIRIWNVARTPTQILGNLTTQLSSASGLVASYGFNHPSGSLLADLSGNGNDGTLTNFDFLGTSSDWVASTVPSCAPSGKFIGSANSDWSNPANWCGGVVPAANNVVENIVVSINSDITETQDLVLNANDFQVASGASLVLNLNSNSVQLTNNATFTNNGTVNVSNGTGVNATAGSFINNGVFFFDAGTQLASPEGTFINYGILKGFFTVNNNFTNPSAGTVAPGASPGCANFVSDFTNSGTLEVEIDGTIPCSQYDQISVGGTANLGGTLNVTLGFTPVSGNEFVIIDATAISGTFTTVNLPDANWSIAYDFPATGQVSLSYVDPTEMIGSTGPGGVGATDGTSPLQLWVKADAGTGTTTDDVTVSSWTDQSGFGRNMTGVNSPSFKNNIINGMPVLQFAAAQSDYFQSIGFTDNFDAAGFTIFTVAQMTGTGDQGFIGFKSQTGSFNGNVTFFLDDVNGTATDLRVSSPSTGTLGSTQWASDNRSPRLLSFTRSTSLLNAYDGGTNVVSNLAEGAIFNGTDPWMIGRYNNDNLKHFTGDVAEFVLFEGVLNTASRTIVENHLSAKYDIAHSVDLYAGDTAPNGDFDFDVIGIGMEADGSDPGGAAGGIILTNAGFLQDDGDYLFAGHDGSAHGFVQTDLPGSYTNRWARSWYVDVTDSTTLGTGGLVTVTFDFDEAGLGLPNANLALITRPGTTGNYAVASTDFLIAGNKVSFTLDASAIIDGHTYTIADDFVPNNALLFDGVAGNFVQGPDLTGQITNDFTFETWFRTTASDHRMMIALGDHLGGAGAQAQLKVNSNSVMFGVNALSSVVSPSATYTDGSWHHAAGVYSGTLLTLYLDGELIDTTSAPLSMDLSAFKIGDHSGGNLVWDGELDNMRIWNVARTQSEIVANAYNTLSSDSTLVVSYDFNSSTGTTLFDQSANSLNGTLVGTPPAWVSSTAWDIDIFAPTFEAGYPTITNINQNDFDLTVQLNEEGAVYYVVLPDSATVPSIDDIKAGTDGLGGAAVVASNFPVNLIGSEVIANITGLTDGTSYDVYVVAEDNEGAPNTQKVAVTFDITTLAFPENALSFDGTDDYVDIVHNASQNLSTFTLEAWVKTEQAAGAHIRIIMKPVAGNQNYSLAINNGYAHVRFDGSGGVQAEGTTLINDGKWHHLAGVFDNANDLISIYVDGVLEQQNATAQNPVTGSSPLYLGWSGVGQHYEGEMDQVRIWNTVRTQAELINHMNQSLNAEAGLVASYDFNTGIPGGDNTGLNTLADISGNGHDGTLNAFDLVGDTSNWVASGAFAPIIYQVSAANLNNLSVNWQPTNRGQVYVDINDASNFAGVPHATGHQIGNGSNSTSIVTGLSLAPNTRYFARIYYQDGGFTSPYSDTVEFMINAGSALDFDGTDDFISIPDHPDLNFGTGDFTVEFWINTTTTNKAIVSKRVSDPDWWRVALSGGNVYFELGVGNTPLTSTSVVNNGLWHHVAARRAGGTGYIYIDGVLEATGAFSESASNSHPVEIGSWQNGAQALYLGQLDEVRIWNVDRSLAEIQSSINNTLAGNENGLVAYYRFDEGDTAAVNTGISSPEVMDLSGNGNAGTMSGFAKTGATSNWVASGAFTLDNNTAPLAPTDVIAFSNSSNNIILQWKDNAYNETGYLIENADDYDFTLNVDTVVADLGVNATSFVHSAGADQGYFYRVTPVNGFETGASTSEVEFATTKSFPGYALNFDGIADSVDMGSTGDLQISGALTYEVWIKTTQTQGFILGKRNSSDLADLASNIELDGTGKIQGLVYDGIAGFPDVIQSNVAVNDGEWHHVAFVFEPSVALRLYIDGVLDKTFGISSTNINGASYPFRVGKYPTSSSAFFDGEMDEIRVWNDVRSDAEIFDNLYHDLKGDESNLVAYYPMDENSGTKLVDRSVNTNDGDIGGAGFIVSDVPLGPPMYLLSSTPLVNETNIARSANIQMTFDANVDAATLNDNIVVMGSHSGIITGVFFGGGTSVITFDPDNDFLAGEYVSAIISEKVRGLNGEVAVSYNLQFAIATGPFQGAFVEQTTGLEGVVDGAAAWADYDGDGDLDVAVSGWDFDYTFVIAKIFNNSGGTFTDIGASLTGVYEGSLDWGDYDGDGDLDLFATGFNDGGSRTASLYQNNAGTFSDVGGSFQGVSYSEADWGDFDNDGDLDLAVQGDYTASLSSTSIYVNEGGTFTTLNAGLVGANTGDLSWGDYDNDGDLDLVSMGYTSSSASIITTIYRNDNGVFTDIAAGLEGKFYGSVNWGDYDNDNDLDLLVSGSNTDNAPIIYRNDAGTFVDISAGLLENAEGESAWGDFDGDGDLDVVINGSGETNDPTTTIYINNAGSFVNSAIRVDNYLYSTVDWGDYDNDGDLDLLMTGTDDLNGGRISLYSNDLAPPKVLNATSVSTAGFTPNLIAPSGAVDLIVDVSTDPQFGSFISQDVSVGISGGVDINTTLTAGTQYFYRAKTDFGGGEESSYYISNSFMIQPGNALPFTGDDYVEVFDNPVLEPTDDFTIEFWFNTNVTGNRVFVEKGTGNTEYSVQQYSGDVLGLNVNGAMQTNGSYNDSTWHHAAFIYRGPGDGTIYVDGVEDVNAGSVAALGAPTYSLGRLTIGDRRFGGSFNIEGIIDEVRIWDDERTLTEIDDHRYKTLIGDEQGLIAYYQFDELSGLGLKNLSDNLSLDGSLENMVGNEWTASGALGAFGTVVSITADEANPAGSAIASELDWNIQFTSPVTGLTPGNFTLNSSGIGGGSSVSSVTDVDGFNWTITATVDAGDGTIGVDFTNDAGLNATITNAPFVGEVYTVDRTVPAATLTSSEPDPTNSGSFTVDIIFSEGVTGLGLGSIIVGNGTASNLVDLDGISYTVDITPGTDGLVSVDLGAGAAQDIAGNDNSAASTFSINYDTTGPTPAISSLESDPTNSSPFIVNIDFTEPVTGFDLTDVTVTNGSKANLTEAQNYAYDSQFGSAGSADGQFNDPYAVAEDGSGDIWVADRLNNRLQEFDPAGNFMQSVSFSAPIGLAVDGSDNLYVTRTNNLVYKIDQSGSALLTIGTSGSGAGQFANPSDVAIDHSTGDIYVTDYNNAKFLKYNAAGDFQWEAGGNGSGDGLFNYPTGIVVFGSTVYVTDDNNNRVQAFDTSGNFLFILGGPGTGDGQLQGVDKIDVDGNGNVYVLDRNNHRFQVFSSGGNYLGKFGSGVGSSDGEFNFPRGIAVSASGDVLISDGGNNRIQRIKGGPSGNFNFELTPAADGLITVNVGGSVATDLAGNLNNSAVQFSITADSQGPDVTINQSGSQLDPTNGTIVYDVIFSEPVSGFTDDTNVDFASSTVGGALSGTVTEEAPLDGTTYTLTVSGMSGTGDVIVNIQGGAASDLAGNVNSVSTSTDNTVTYDDVPPNLTITTPIATDNYINNAEASSVIISGASDAEDGQTVTLTIFDGSSTLNPSAVLSGGSWSVAVDFSSLADGNVTITADVTDLVGNAATSVNTNVTLDQTAPVVSLSTTEPDPTNSGVIPISITFSEGMSGFDVTDLTVGNGAASNFVDIDGTNYSADIYPSSDGLVTVDISAGVAFDAASNGNEAAPTLSITYDATVPTLDFVGIYSSNSNSIWAMVGDDVFVDFTSSEGIENVIVYIAGNVATIDDLADANDQTWSASYTMQVGDTEGSIAFSIDFDDLAGNTGVQVTTTTDASDVSFDKTDPNITGNSAHNIIENTTAIGTYSSGEIVIWSLSGDDASSLTIDGAGSLSFVSNPDFESPGDFNGDNIFDVVVEATDEAGNVATLAVSITVTDEDEINPVISGNITPSVQENTTSVGTYTADESVTWSLSGTDASEFSISSGVLSFLSPPDFESPTDGGANNVYDLVVTGTDAAGNIGTLAVSVTVTDVDEINPVISGNTTPSVQENTTSVGTYTADESVTWSLSGTDASAFSISSGVLSFLSPPDFESPTDGGANNVYDLIVTGTDGAGNIGTLAVSVTVTDVDEINPVISGSTTPSVQENMTSVGTYTADESVTWSLSGTDASAFSISSGVLSFLSPPDFESPTDGGANNVYDLIVTGTDAAGNIGTLAVSVTVTDVDEINPVISGSTTPSVQENTTSVGTYTADESVTWSLSGTDASAFSISSGVLNFLSPPDFESPTDGGANNVYDLIVTGTDGAGNIGTLAVSVTVTDLDEIDPVVSGDDLPELVEGETLVGNYTADETVTWSLAGVDASFFTLSTGGELSFASAPDYDTPLDAGSDNIYEVTLQATDGAGNVGSLAVSVKVLQSDVVPPVITGNDIPELPENTTLVGAYTADESVTWSLSGEDASLFSVSASGELSLLTEADFEVPSDADGNNTYLLTITATDGQGNFSDLSLVVTVTDTNDNTPEIVDPGSVSVDENSEAGTLVVGLMATDADTGTTFSWSLGTGNEDLDGDGSAPFIIDEATGDLMVNDPDDLDYESGTISFSLQVIVEDGANAQGITVFIEVNDLDETIAVSFDEVVTNDPSPALTGMVDDLEAGIEVSVDGNSYQAVNNGDGTWQLAGAVIADLSDGTYEVTVMATGLSGGQFGSVTGTLIIDLLAPSISIDALVTNITSPELTGTVDDQDAVIQVTVNGIDYEANNLGDGSWILAAGVIESLSEGIYEVTVMATDAATNEGTAAGTLEIDTSVPVVTVDALETLKDSPSISGSVDDSEASVEITVNGNTYEAVVTGTIWMVEEGTIASLAVGTYDVLATASDAAGNSAEDASTDELVIKPGAPTALAATNVDYFSFTANWKERSGVASYRLDVSSDAAFVNLLSGFDNLSTTATSVAVTGLNYGSVYHYRVRAVYASGDVSGNSNVISVTTPTDAGTVADSLALLSIYEAAGGASWTRTNNWKTTLPLRQWSDITMTGTRVTTVDLSSNNLTGSFPEISEGLEFLTTLDLSGNLLTSLPSLTSLSGLTSLDVIDNKLGFASLEPNAGISGIVYSPQKAAGERIETLEQQGTNFTIDRTVSGSANSYKWFKENLKTNAVTELTNTGSSLTIAIESFNDEGGYFVEVTNGLVSGLTITSEPVILKVSSLERDFAALQNIYDAMGGESWSGEASNWPNETDFADWEGVEIQSERVVGLKLDSIDMTGELPKDILDIAGLKDVDLSGNRISKIPNMTSLSLTSLNVSGNNLEFDDLEPNVQISGISYANQRLIGAAKNDTIVHGSDFTILLEVGGSANAYQWNRTNDLGTGPVSGATSNSYTIEGISYETMGVHTLTVTNSKVPGLTLTSRKQRVLATANLTFTALDLNNELFTEGDGMALRVTAPGNPYDTIQVVRGSTEGFVFEDLILGDYLIAVRADDLVEFLPTYYPSTDLWKEAEEYILREDGEETLRMAQIPPPLPPLPDGGVVGGTIESDFADEEEEDEGGRIESRRKVKRAGCSMRRFVRSGRIDQDGEFILYAYVESDDEGRFNFKDIEPGLYRFNIEYPGIPMDPESFVEFEIGADGKERNSFTLEATVTEEGIVVEKINELGFYRKYFKDLNVYPNPSDEVMHVSYAKMLAQGVVMRLVDLKGNVVLEQAVERGYDMALELDVREIPAGVYLLNFVDTLDRKRSVVTYRVVIRH